MAATEAITIVDKRPKRLREGAPTTLEEVRTCRRCDLAAHCTRVVMGEGPRGAMLVVVGEAPGRTEDETGRPFVGESGNVLNDLLATAGISRRRTFVANAVKCRPIALSPSGNVVNGKPTLLQVKMCRDNLHVELARLNPNLIVCLGDTALYAVTGKSGITKWRGELMSVNLPTSEGTRPVKVLPTFHPASVLYDAGKKPYLTQDFSRAATEMESPTIMSIPNATRAYVCRTVQDVTDLVDVMLEQPLVAFDSETSGPGDSGGLDMRVAVPICLSFTFEVGEGWVVPIRGQLPLSAWDRETGLYDDADLPHYWTPEEWAEVKHQLIRFFSSLTPKTAQHSKFDINVLRTIGIAVNSVVFDTLVAHACVDEMSPHNLEELRTRYTDMARYEGWKDDLKVLPRKGAPYSLIPLDILHTYAAADTDVTFRATKALEAELLRQGEDVQWVFDNINMPLSHALAEIERNGMPVSLATLYRLHNQFNEWITEERQRLWERVEPFSYNSPAQLAKVLFGDPNLDPDEAADQGFLPIIKYTPSGKAASTDADTLTTLSKEFPDHPILRSVLRLRRLEKQKSTYLAGDDDKSGMVKFLDAKHFIHSTFNMFPRTGRLSSSSPNLQNITKKSQADLADDPNDDEEAVDPETLAIRSIFAPPAGYTLMEADYSQLELRIQMYLTDEPALVEAFSSGREVDQHKLTASLMFKVPPEEVTTDLRSIGKRVNFAAGYGSGVPGLIRAAKCSEEEAKEWLALYQEGYPATAAKRKWVAAVMYEQGYVENVFGRRRRFPMYAQLRQASRGWTDLSRKARKEMGEQERQGYNHIIQSTGSDVLSIATVDVLADQQLRDWGVTVNLTLHDALYFLVPIARAEEAGRRIKVIMEAVADRFLGWFLPVDVVWGSHWGAKEGHIDAISA